MHVHPVHPPWVRPWLPVHNKLKGLGHEMEFKFNFLTEIISFLDL
jgi:hypothetical protein